MAINWDEVDKKAKQKDAATYAAQTADFTKVKKPLVSAPTVRAPQSTATGKSVAESLGIKPSTNLLPEIQREAAGGKVLQPVSTPSSLERVADTTAGAVKNWTGSSLKSLVEMGENPLNPIMYGLGQYNKLVAPKLVEGTKTLANNLMDSGAQNIAEAKQGASKGGQLAVDLGSGALQLAGDVALGAATGGGTAIPAALRGFGSGIKEAADNGGSRVAQIAYGTLNGLATYFTNEISNAGLLKTAYGKGALDDVFSKAAGKAISKFTASPAGQEAAKRIASGLYGAAGEGFENIIQDAITPLFKKVTYSKESLGKLYDENWLTNTLYDGLVGGILGGAAGSVKVDTRLSDVVNDANANKANVNTPSEATQAPTIDSTSQTTIDTAKATEDNTAQPKRVDLDNLPEMGIGVAMTSDKTKPTLSNKLSNLYTRVVDTQSPIADRFAKDAKDRSGILASNTRNAGGIVNYIFTDNLVDTKGNVIGESFKDIVNEIPKGTDGKGTDFWLYMAQRHNIDRAREGKNVDPTYTSEMSQKYVENAEAANPEYKAIGDNVVNWIDKFEKAWGVDSGLISSDVYGSLREKYKSYFPTQREFSDMETGLPREVTRQFVDPKSPLKTATGSGRDLNNPVENIMNLVNMRVKSARYNEVGQEILKSIRNNPEGLKKYAEIVNEKDVAGHMTNNIVSVIENGERVYLKINDKPFLEALMGLPKNTTSIKVVSDITQGFKNLITQKNPFFAVRNVARDIPTAYTYGSEGNPFKFGLDLLKAGKDVATNSPNYQRYKAVGGGMSNFFNSGNVEKAAIDLTNVGKRDALISNLSKTVGDGKLGKAVTGTANAVLHPIETVEKFNNITESAPRVAEFNRVFEKTGDVQRALDASNNVTVNFARGGDVTKALDRNGVAYLNAGVQGLDKFVRSVNSPRKLATMLVRGGISITAPTLLLAYINKDDEDYDELTNYVKDNYYCIPIGAGHNDGVAGNGEFIKIPRSRELGVLMGALTERLMRTAKGEEKPFKDYGKSLATSFAPANPLTNNIATPALRIALGSNENFMGAAIVPQSMIQDGRSKYLQYDEKTSEITKYIAKYAHEAGVELSPKQMDYLIDAYTGVIADFALPASTVGGNVGNVVKKQFVADSATSNQVLSDFYDKLDEATQKASDKNITNNIDSKTVTLEEKIKTNYSNASKEISALSKVSMRTAVKGLTDEDKKLLDSYGIDSTAPIQDIQKAVRMQQIEIAKEATARGTKADEMELDLNNSSAIAKSVEKYQAAGITQKQAYDFYKTVSALDVDSGTNDGKYAIIKTISGKGYTDKQAIALVGTLYTTKDEETGVIKKESMLPYLTTSKRLLSLYLTQQDASLINMTIPEKFSRSSVEYVLTDAEKAAYKTAYANAFNMRVTSLSSADGVAAAKKNAENLAELAVLKNR